MLLRPSRLKHFIIRDCGRLEFVILSSISLTQTPPELTIENVQEIVSLPKGLFKNPASNSEKKCAGSSNLKGIYVRNSKINNVVTTAIYNVSGVKTVEFDNVTINYVQSQGIDALLGDGQVTFTMRSCKIDELAATGITVHAKATTLTGNTFGDLKSNSINVTAEVLQLTHNRFGEIASNSLVLKSNTADITDNRINRLKTNGFSSIKCSRKGISRRHFHFVRNVIENIEPNSLLFDYSSCNSVRTPILFSENKIDCKCRNIDFLNSVSTSELNALILDPKSNNTCLVAPCRLPVDVVKLLIESDMCRLNLDPQVMCLLYYDKTTTTNKETSTNDDVTEPTATFYLIRQANSPSGDASAAMTAIDKDLLKGSHLNMTNRTSVKIVFDSSKDFEETLRNTHKKIPDSSKAIVTPPKEEASRCVGGQCRNSVATNKQKALDFYKYVYAQLRPARNGNVPPKT